MQLGTDNPDFHVRFRNPVRGIVQPALINDIRRLITTNKTPFGICLLILQSLESSRLAIDLAQELKEVVIDHTAIFSCRKAAGRALIKGLNNAEWLEIIQALYKNGDSLSIRLSIELVTEIGYSPFNDKLIVDLALAHIASDDRTIGVLMHLESELPDDRIASFLDHLVAATKPMGKLYKHTGGNEISDLIRHLITRRITATDITPDKLISWIEPLDRMTGYQHEISTRFNALIQKDDNLRRQVQRLVLIEHQDHHTIWQREYLLRNRSPAFSLSSDDVVSLLEALDPADRSDERWRDILKLTQHNGIIGETARFAAMRFAAHRPDLITWIDKLAAPPTPQWEIENQKREKKYRANQAIKYAEHRKTLMAHTEEMRAGDFGWLVSPAKCYLKLFHDSKECDLAHRRIATWVGDEVSEAAHAGFRAYLALNSAPPNAQDISLSIAQGKYWDASYILIAALAEHLRLFDGLDDLPSERLMAGLFSLRNSGVGISAGIPNLEELINTELKSRGLWTDAIRMFYEPQLEAQCKYLNGLDTLMRDEPQADITCELAYEWLLRFPDLQCGPESELIKRLVRSSKTEYLRHIATTRSTLTDLERQRNWDAIRLITDFDQTVERLESHPIEPALLWHLQLGTSSRHENNAHVSLNPKQLEWILSNFRLLWPMVHRPNSVTCGNTNPWDASDYLIRYIHRLGNDSSEDARAALKRLQEGASDGYTQTINSVVAEQARLRTETVYSPPTLDAINAITRETPPMNAGDLQALVIEELKIVQSMVKSDDAESWRGFYDDSGTPFKEERCRDHLIGLLRQGSKGLTLDPEGHVAADKEVDIACSVGALRLPIEIKGQWHRDLWNGADTQLDRLYTPDWRADGRGIYLVLWFGQLVPENKQLKSPGRGTPHPETPAELRDMLFAGSNSAREGRVVVFVIDLSR